MAIAMWVMFGRIQLLASARIVDIVYQVPLGPVSCAMIHISQTIMASVERSRMLSSVYFEVSPKS
jgi:hypothetical protein